MKTIGIDGCKSGWFSVSLTETAWETAIHENIQELWLSRSGSESILIDIPIGFRNNEPLERLCDLAARKALGPGRGSSVFPTPCRAAVYCSSYEAAHIENKRSVDRGLSKQTWAIVPKIHEVDAFLRSVPESLAVIRESHPEVAFWGLNGRVPLKHGKKTAEGLEERIQILSQYDERAEAIYQASMKRYLRKDAASDDIIDALCLAVSGLLILRTEMHTLPTAPETDEFGIPMQIAFAAPHPLTTSSTNNNSANVELKAKRFPRGSEYPNEGFIQNSVEQHFSESGFTQYKFNEADYAGLDDKTGARWVIEAKGETKQIGLDFRTCLGQLIQGIDSKDTKYGIAVPALPQYLAQCRKMAPWVREALGLHWIIVDESGKLMILEPGTPL